MSPDPLNAQGNSGSQLEVEQISLEIGSVSFLQEREKHFYISMQKLDPKYITFVDHIGKILNRMSSSLM